MATSQMNDTNEGAIRPGGTVIRRAAFAGALLLVTLSTNACGGGDDTKPSTNTNDPTLTNVMAQVISSGNCAGPQCHSSALLSGFSLGSKDHLYSELVNQPAAGPQCKTSGLVRVVPDKPDQSLLYLKISHTAAPCGDNMPVGSSLSDGQIDLVNRWILAGAQND